MRKEVSKENRKVKMLFITLIVEIYVVCMLGQLASNRISIANFITQSLIFILLALVIILKRDFRVFSILFFTLVYGTAIIYNTLLVNSEETGNIVYIWLVLIPVVGITALLLINKIDEGIAIISKKEHEKSLVLLDEVTGYRTESALIKELKREIVKAKRHKYKLSIMIVELQYYNELKRLYSSKDINEIYMAIANAISNLARIEDTKFRYKENQFILVLPFTDIQGVEVVKSRFKENLKRIKVSSLGKGEDILTFKYKIAVKEYDGISEDPIKLLNDIERELEYDV